MRIAHGLGRGNAAERRRGVFLNPGLKSGVGCLDSFSEAAVCAITIGIGPRFSVGCVAWAAWRGCGSRSRGAVCRGNAKSEFHNDTDRRRYERRGVVQKHRCCIGAVGADGKAVGAEPVRVVFRALEGVLLGCVEREGEDVLDV